MASKSRLTSSGYGTKRAGSFAGKAVDLGILFDQWLEGVKESRGPQKPGIPAGTSEWLKTMLEILTGRRGNAIDVPTLPDITFSATPTQAEIQTLYDAVKTTHDLVRQIRDRLDS